MKMFATALLFAAFVIGVRADVEAATLFTAPLPGGAGGVYCQALNATTVPRDVTITIFDANAMTVNTQTCAALAAFHSCTLGVPGAFTPPHVCRVDVAGTKPTVRASIVRLTGDGTPAVALPAQ